MKHKKSYYAALTAFVLSWMTFPAFAAENVHGGGDNSVTTKDVVVTASQAQEAAKYESQSTTIITAEDIEKKQAKSVEDIIFNETGVTRTIDAMGRVGVSIRGAEPRHTLILVDGQPVMGDFAKYSGQGDELQRIGTENVERIEIIRGAASAKYGADAIGGVVNVITKKASKDAGLQINAEGRRAKGDGDLFPYQNFFLRADSGEIGKFRAAVYGGKREIMPIYSQETFRGMAGTDGDIRNSLRYYGDIKNIGMSASYDIDDRNKIELNLDKTSEDMQRYVKHSDSDMEPQQQFKRTMDRNSYRLTYTGNNGGSTDWTVDVDYSKMTEDDITLSSYFGNSKYEGKNTLNYVDDIMHKQWNVKASANTQVNDKHLLTYGFSYTKETGEGSRLKNAPNPTTKYIDPWDYDKNLYTAGGKGAPSSTVHDYDLYTNADGIPQYNIDSELYGKDENGNVIRPPVTYDEMKAYYAGGASDDLKSRFAQFVQELTEENPKYASYGDYIVMYGYYSSNSNGEVKYKGHAYKEEYEKRQNRVTSGRAEIKKEDFFLQDTWQVNDNTILAPIFRINHSDLFGTEATFNLGLTHNLCGHANRRLKANIGTGYTEPGMGELYYSWEMYAGSPVGTVPGLGSEVGRLGYYWVGNPDLKPEKSVNFDLGVEGENGKTSARFNVFHNKIDDYMTTYFTGYLLDFDPTASSLTKWMSPPDMIYSFKNIGRAEITGVEAEINHQFNKHWSGKLGYTYLHAINKSDSNMPRQLLDKPQHKVDIGVTYQNKGWTASLWGNYYIHMLDSNSIANNGNYYVNGESVYAKSGSWTYQKKTFGLWNILVQKELSPDARVYVGIDNIFNHRDDDRAFQERVYKFGVNLKFGSDGSVKADTPTVKKAVETAREKIRGEETTDWFIKAPFDTAKKEGVEVIGDYRARWNSFTGKIKPSEARVTAVASVGDAYKNYLEKADHGFEQRIRLGVDARIGDNTNVTVLGSASGMSGVDTMYDKSDSKGLNHQRVENIDVTQHANKWDFSVGRLTEPMGVTGYWFGKEYDGGRAVWTSGKNQVRIGYGDFSHSTGISDSAYTHATRQTFQRGPTKDEWLGINRRGKEVSTEGYEGLFQKLKNAANGDEERQLIKDYLAVIKEKDPEGYQSLIDYGYTAIYADKLTLTQPVDAIYKIDVTDFMTGESLGSYIQISHADAGRTANLRYTGIMDMMDINASAYAGKAIVEAKSGSTSLTIDGQTVSVKKTSTFLGYGTYTGSGELSTNLGISNSIAADAVTESDFTKTDDSYILGILQDSLDDLWDRNKNASNKGLSSWAWNTLNQHIKSNWKPEDNSSLPLTFFSDGSAGMVTVLGTVLQRDTIPSIDRAFFAQYKHQMGDHFGVQAWWLRSVNDDTHSLAYAHGDSNDVYSYDRLANIIGLGAAWRVSDNLRFSFDWGQNRTDFGRMMNGSTIYSHESGTSTFDIEGRSKGGTPRFWTARIDVGHADMDKPGSWNAFADYKYFQHGSFFGGNGTEALPDRYLDGIKSFTIGGGYVPAKDFLIEAFYTFDAKGIGKRDTLYGGENFTLGDYTRIQATFRF